MNIYLTQLTTRSGGVVSGQSFGSSTVSLACITSMCSVQCFPGGHSLRLAFGSFFYRLILAVFCCCGQTVFFLRCLRLRLAFVQSLFLRNLGRQSWRNVRPCVWPWFLLGCFVWYFMVGKFDNSLVAVFSRNDCGFAFTCLAVKRLTNLAIKRSTSLAV